MSVSRILAHREAVPRADLKVGPYEVLVA